MMTSFNVHRSWATKKNLKFTEIYTFASSLALEINNILYTINGLDLKTEKVDFFMFYRLLKVVLLIGIA